MPRPRKYNTNEQRDEFDELYRRISVASAELDALEKRMRNMGGSPLPRLDILRYPYPFEGQRAIDVADEQHAWYSNGEWRKAAAGGVAVYEIKVFEDINVIVAGDGAFWWPIPDDLDAGEIIYADAGVSTVSSSGPVEVQIAHQPGGTGSITDILSTKISIAAGNKNATPGVVNGTVWPVSNGDWLRIDVDAAGVGAKGLAVMVGLTPSPLGSVAVQGATGPPGGITAWEGAWTTSTTYQIGDAVSHNGSSYVAITNHTSGASTEPGVGASWETAWMLLAGAQQITEVAYIMTGNGFVLDPGIKGPGLPIYFAATIVEATLLADLTGSVVLDIWKDTYGTFPPTDADSITGASPLTLSSANKTTDTTLTGWTTSVAAGDVLRFNIDSISLITSLTVGLKLTRI